MRKDKEFISTGKENRDLATFYSRLSAIPGLEFDLYTSPANGDQKYEKSPTGFKGKQYPYPHSRRYHTVSVSTEVARSKVVVISRLNYPYTVGLNYAGRGNWHRASNHFNPKHQI